MVLKRLLKCNGFEGIRILLTPSKSLATLMAVKAGWQEWQMCWLILEDGLCELDAALDNRLYSTLTSIFTSGELNEIFYYNVVDTTSARFASHCSQYADKLFTAIEDLLFSIAKTNDVILVGNNIKDDNERDSALTVLLKKGASKEQIAIQLDLSEGSQNVVH